MFVNLLTQNCQIKFFYLNSKTRDEKGRSTGYTYAKNGTVQQTVTTGYDSDGRIASAGFLHGGSEKQFSYEYLSGTHLLEKLTMPNNMTLTQSYEIQRDLLTGMAYKRGSTLVANRQYSYDSLGRPTARNTSRQGTVKNDTFVYNNRSELTTATVNGNNYAYDYDNIGNRETATESDITTNYTANALNQYTAVGDFTPTFDADGNQTLVKTTTGIWSITYDAENRPVSFTNAETNTGIECAYDHMGRRATKKVTIDGEVTLHQRYIYRGYLQIACCDLTRSNHPALWLITWDPTQPIATRPLAIQKDGTWFTYGWDLTKNICELYGSNGYIRTAYTYTPYGEVTESANGVYQPIQWSSEYNDTELGLVYYNYRHYNQINGKWVTRDPVPIKTNTRQYTYVNNSSIMIFDVRGLYISLSDYSISSCEFSHLKKCPKGARKRQKGYYEVDIPGYHCSGKQYEYRTNTPKKNYTPSVNGCGGKDGIKFPENFLLYNIKEACNIHDRCYGTCGEDRLKCDAGLLWDIYTICIKEGGVLLHAHCLQIAYAYSGVVLIARNEFYEEGQDEGCEWQPCVE